MPNHLVNEKSPYLLQHVHNPVDWYAWGPEAFEKARSEDKPIFLSIGYSTCHWCHVMERESFENTAIAKLLNDGYVSIKVDREERPDVDRIYMAFVQATSGGGGWPMSVFLTPDLKPFFGGTYFPPDNRYGRPGFILVLESLARSWKNDRAKIEESSRAVIQQLIEYTEPKEPKAALDRSVLETAYGYFRRNFDSTHGGFGNAPKFPRPVIFSFLFRYYARTRDQEALDMALQTLRAMAEGGMNDQLGGGFHRYSVDERWFVPHFEKMLYDQAQLVISYLEAYQLSGDSWFAGVARRTLDYVLRDMTGPGGAFYSAEDADSVVDPAHPHEKAEGAFYVWTRQELDQLLPHPDASIFAFRHGVEANGNVEHDPHGEFPGKNILSIAHTLEETARRFRSDPAAVEASLSGSASILYEKRTTRVRPHLDDKILAAWNGLMISAFAKAAQILNEPKYAEAAQRAAGFVIRFMYDAKPGTLLRRFRDQDAAIPGFLDDYAFFANGLLDLYETDFDPAHLETAQALTRRMIELFEDPEAGAFFSTASGDASLVLRMKDDYDGAEPAGNSLAWLVLLRLGHLTGDAAYAKAAERTQAGLASRIVGQPVAVPLMLVALEMAQSPYRQIVIAAAGRAAAEPFLRESRRRFAPHSVTLLIDGEATRERLVRISPQVAAMREMKNEPGIYVCQDFTCRLPVSNLADFRALIQ